MAADRKIPEYDDDECIVDKRGSKSTPKESLQILPTRWENLAASEEAEWHTTSGGDAGRRPIGVDDGVPRESLVRTSRDMGHIQEGEREVLVAGNV